MRETSEESSSSSEAVDAEIFRLDIDDRENDCKSKSL